MEFKEGFNEIDWLNNYFDSEDKIDRENIRSVLYFALMWNMFEALACQRSANVRAIEEKVNDIYCRNLLRSEDFIPYLEYFQNRYLTAGQVNETFDKLRFRDHDKKELVKNVMQGELDDPNNIVLALLLVVFRLRNNLFHGEKNIYRLNFQIDNFKVANQILAKFLTLLKQ
jgi:hypothetical protein